MAKRHSIIIGVGLYEGSPGLPPLKCPSFDVEAVTGIASDPRYMGDDPQYWPKIDPTLSEASQHITSVLRNVSRDDVLMFYFSGHGLRSANGDLFLCFKDTVETDLELTALNIRRLRDVFESKLLRRVLVVLDCCYSGAAGAQMTRAGVSDALNGAERPQPGGKGLYILSSAGANETAKEGTSMGVFTHHLVAGVRTGEADLDGNGDISVQELAHYLLQKVPEDAPDQTPTLSANAASGTFVVALNESMKRRQAKLEADARREGVFKLARIRVIDAFKQNDVEQSFMDELLAWMKENTSCPLDSLRFLSIEAYARREVGLVKFAEGWTAQGAHQAAKQPAVSLDLTPWPQAERSEAQTIGGNSEADPLRQKPDSATPAALLGEAPRAGTTSGETQPVVTPETSGAFTLIMAPLLTVALFVVNIVALVVVVGVDTQPSAMSGFAIFTCCSLSAYAAGRYAGGNSRFAQWGVYVTFVILLVPLFLLLAGTVSYGLPSANQDFFFALTVGWFVAPFCNWIAFSESRRLLTSRSSTS